MSCHLSFTPLFFTNSHAGSTSSSTSITAGETTDVISSSVAVTTAVEDNYLTAGQKDVMKKEIEACGKDWKCRNDAYDRWHNKDKNTNMAEKIGSDMIAGFIGLYRGIKTINNLDTASMPLVAQGSLGYIMVGKERALGENESFFNIVGRMEDIQEYIEDYNNVKNLLDQNKSR